MGRTYRLLDILMANAWRPLEEERQGSWRYRWTEGVTGRANSVLAIDGEDDLDRLVERAESFYAERAAPARFLVSDVSAPATLSDHLAARGYRPEKPTLMMMAGTAEVASSAGGGTWSLRVAATVSDEWFDCYWSWRPSEGARHETPRSTATCCSLPAVRSGSSSPWRTAWSWAPARSCSRQGGVGCSA